MSITDRIQSDLTAAMKARDRERVSALRMVLSGLKMEAKEAGGGFGEEQEIAVLKKEKKRRLQAAEAFRAGGREESAVKEESEADLIDTYLPQEMNDAELEAIIAAAIGETGASGMQDMGKVMSAVMGRAAGRADGGRVSALVRQKLA